MTSIEFADARCTLDKEEQDPLEAVYEAKSPQEIARLYDGWSAGYDADMARAGYRHPTIATALLTRHLPRGATPILDAGAGTGLLGEWLGLLGYDYVEALDISAGMLETARAKGVYRALHHGALGEKLPFRDKQFAGVLCAGVLTTGHVGVEALPELLRVVQRGGTLVMTIKETLWTNAFQPALARGVASGTLRIAEVTEPYISMPGEAQATPSRAIVVGRT